MAQGEARIRQSFKNQKGAEGFVASERAKILNRMLGIDDMKGVYRDASAT